MNIEEQLRKIIADIVFQLAVLMAENDKLRQRISELGARNEKST